MEYFHVVLTSLFSIAALFVITKLLGYRQMSQLSMFDYINGITIGSIAAELANSEWSEFGKWANCHHGLRAHHTIPLLGY